jgi:hypothetical protein
MRLPGTWNLGADNSLPTPEFLQQYREFKTARHAVDSACAKTEYDKANEYKSETNGPDHCTANTKAKKMASQKSKQKNEQATTSDEKKIDSDFTKAQDKALIELKHASKSWKDIAVELGKDVSEIKERWRDIKPTDFDSKLEEEKKKSGLKKAKADKNKGGGNTGRNDHGAEKEGKKVRKGQDFGEGGGKKSSTGPMQADGNWSKKDASFPPLLKCLSSITD